MRWIAWGKKTVPVSGRSGAQSSVASTRQTVTVQRGSVLDVRGPEWFCQPFCSLWMSTVLGEWGGLYQWFTQQSGLPSVVFCVRFGSWAEPDSYWRAEDGFNDGRVELYQQLLWQVKLPQLAKEVQPVLGLFYNGVYVIVPLQVLRDGGAQEPEWLHCSHSAVHDGEWGESRGVSPEVHDHLHCFEDVKLQVVKTAPDSQLLNLLFVSRLVTVLDEADQCGVVCKLQELERGVFRCAVVGVQGNEQWGENTALRRSSADGTGAGWEFSQPH